MKYLRRIPLMIACFILGWYLHYFHVELTRLAVYDDLYAIKEENKSLRIDLKAAREELYWEIVAQELGLKRLSIKEVSK